MQTVPSPSDTLSERDQQFLRSYNLIGQKRVEFFTRQPMWLMLFMLLSLGTYALYWFYRNWDAVRTASGRKMWPLARALLAIFYAWPMFRIMILQARLQGRQVNYSGGLLALGYVLPGFFLGLTPRAHFYNDTFLVGEIIIAVTSSCMILLTQRAAQFSNARQADLEAEYSPVRTSEVVCVLLFCVLPIVLNLLGR